MKRRVLWPAVLVLAAWCGVGCGDSSEADAVREFQRDAQALCREAIAAVTPPENPDDPRALARSLRRALGVSGEFVRRFDALDAPSELERPKRRVIALERRDDAVWRKVVARLERGEAVPKAFAPYEERLARNRALGDALFDRLGMSACTSDAADDSPT